MGLPQRNWKAFCLAGGLGFLAAQPSLARTYTFAVESLDAQAWQGWRQGKGKNGKGSKGKGGKGMQVDGDAAYVGQ